MRSHMDVPEQFLKMYYGPGSDPERREKFEEWIKSKRNKLKNEPAFETPQEAIEAAKKLAQREEYSFPSVWREPKDVGKRYTVIHTRNRENAYVSGYTEVVDEQKIFDIANGRQSDSIDEIEEI